jgi:hypothetical protein
MSGLIPGEGHVAGEPWWSPAWASERHRHVIDWVVAIRNRQERWRKRDLLHACLYGNMEILGFGPSNFWKVGQDDGRLSCNIVKPKVDTWVSLICRSKPEAMFLPNEDGAVAAERWTLKRRCKQFERFANGKLEEMKFHEDVAPLMVLDVGIFDYGLCKVSISGVDDQTADWRHADVAIERAYPHQIVINDAEAMNGSPRTMAQRQPIDRYVLAAKFPSQRAQILDCPKGFQADESGTNEEDSDVLCVTEIWHLPSKASTDDDKWNGSDDGRHCLVIENASLIDEPYECDRFPFSRLTQMPIPMGIRGQSIVHQIRPVQVSLNQLLLDFQDAAHTMARPKWLSPRQGSIEKAHFDDQVASIIEYDAPYKPEAWCPPTLPGDVYQLMKDHWEWADNIIGISGGRSGGTVPTNLKSGKAIDEANDTQDGRFLISSRLFEACCMDVVDLMISKGRVVAKHRKDYASRYIDSKKSMSIVVPFKDVASLKREQYTLDCYPASALANTPGRRFDQLAQMKADGDIARETYLKLLDWPDLAGELKQLNAPLDLADMLIERYLNADDPDDPEVWLSPEPRWPIQTLYQRFLFATVDAQTDGCPDKNLALMERFMSALEDAATKQGLQLPGMPAPNMGAANTAAPLGVPGGTPMPMGAPPGMPPPPGAGPPMPPGAGAPPSPMMAA